MPFGHGELERHAALEPFGERREQRAVNGVELERLRAMNALAGELTRPALFVPEMKFGSELLKEMQRKNQQMAIVIDEYGTMAGIVTIEDLVEEIVGEIGEEDRRPAPDVLREAGGSMVMRGSVPIDKVSELFGATIESASQHANATTIAGLLNGVAGHVPRTGEVIEYDGLRFEVLEANQRKVLRVRARRVASAASSAGTTSGDVLVTGWFVVAAQSI